MEAKRSWLAFVKHMTSRCDQIQAIRPTCVGGFYAVIKIINDCRKLNAELSNTGSGNGSTLRFISRATNQYFIAHVGLHLPHIRGMSLKDVHGIEGNFVLILLGKLVQGGNLPPEGWSRVAAKYQYDGPCGPQRSQ